MKDIILDILRYTANTGFFDYIKITGDDEKTQILTSDSSQSIIVNAETKKPIPEFIGTFGLGNLRYLHGVAHLDVFKQGGAEVSVQYKDRGGVEIAEQFTYASHENGTNITYRLMHESTVPSVPVFRGTEWDLIIKPTREKIAEFSQLATLHAEIEEQFIAKTVDGNLVFYIGEEGASTHKARFVFCNNVTGNINVGMKWQINHALAALRLSESGDSVVKFSNKGVICVTVDSGLAVYNIILLASQK